MYIGYLTDTGGKIVCHTNTDNSLTMAKAPDIFFIAAAPYKEMVEQALGAVEEVYKLPIPMKSPQETDDQCYVYAYFTDPKAPTWENCFYIGKGIKDRWSAHVADRCKPSAAPAGSNKERHIDAWLVEERKVAGKLNAEKLRRQAIEQGLVRKLGGWTGPHKEACAFSAEHFLIKGFRNVYALANETGGNGKTGALRVLARDEGLNMASESHLAAWKDTIATFMAKPDKKMLGSRLRPLLHLLSYQRQSESLDHSLADIGLYPQDRNDRHVRQYENVPSHFSVEGASDSCMTYETKDQRPFRVQIKLSKKEAGAVVNVRPRFDKKAEQSKYFSYFNSITIGNGTLADCYGGKLPISGGNKTPYFKPFACDGVGDLDTLFPLDSKHSATGTANWIPNGKFTLTLQDALKLFLAKFP